MDSPWEGLVTQPGAGSAKVNKSFRSHLDGTLAGTMVAALIVTS